MCVCARVYVFCPGLPLPHWVFPPFLGYLFPCADCLLKSTRGVVGSSQYRRLNSGRCRQRQQQCLTAVSFPKGALWCSHYAGDREGMPLNPRLPAVPQPPSKGLGAALVH